MRSLPLACQAPLSMGFSGQEYWSELPFPTPKYLPDTGIELGLPTLQAGSLPLSHQERAQGALSSSIVLTQRCLRALPECFGNLSVGSLGSDGELTRRAAENQPQLGFVQVQQGLAALSPLLLRCCLGSSCCQLQFLSIIAWSGCPWITKAQKAD